MTLANLKTNLGGTDIGVDDFTLMDKLELTYYEAMILKLIWISGDAGINLAHIGRSTRQHIYNMRPKLIKKNISIVNMGGRSYGMPRASRERLEEMFNLSASS